MSLAHNFRSTISERDLDLDAPIQSSSSRCCVTANAPNWEDICYFYSEAVKYKQICGPTWDGKCRLSHLQYMADRVKLKDLSLSELQRIWGSICGDPDGAIDHKEFVAAVRDEANPASVFLCSLIRSLRDSCTHGHQIPANYDYQRSTNDNYSVDGLNFYGDFAEIRAHLDYSYHVNYTQERQKWQDHAIRSVITRTKPHQSPWLVYTCGPMGVGKGYTLAWMSENGFFPLENIVHVDPDAFKMMMPEWSTYVHHDRDSAGTMCHRESAFMMEIAQGAAMLRGQNIWIDGSLRDAEHYSKQFMAMREQFPLYQISIFYVYASESTIFSRIAERKEKTGRDVPEHLVRESLAAMDRSLNMLTPLCDFVARIENEGVTPVLRAFEKVDTSGCWNSIRSRFARKEEAQFPDFLPPLHLTQLPQEYIDTMYQGDTVSPSSDETPTIFLHLTSDIQDPILRKLERIPDWEMAVRLPISPSSPVTLLPKARELAMIPAAAQHFFFIYPYFNGQENNLLDRSNLKKYEFTDRELSSPLIQLLRAGGFGYSNRLHDVIQVSVISSMHESSLLQFGRPHKVSRGVHNEIEKRLRPVATKSISSRGGISYMWVLPDEKFGSINVGGPYGSFLFEVGMGAALNFSHADSANLVRLDSGGQQLLRFPVISAGA